MIQSIKNLRSGFIMAGFFVVFIYAATLPSSVSAQILDSDQDGLADDQEEAIFKTSSMIADTDGDGFDDGTEITNGYSPLAAQKKLKEVDSDNDGLTDDWEIKLGTNLLLSDTDNDSHPDAIEIESGYDPLNAGTEKIDKRIDVSLKKQTLAYFFGDIKLDEFLISSGVRYMPTPTGQFYILNKVPIKHYGGTGYNFYYPNTKWNLHFTTSKYRYYIHGAYWHNNFGTPMSHGCVNVAYENMEKLYWFAQVGTRISIL